MSEITNEELEKLVESISIFGGTVTGLKQRRFRFTVKVSIAFGVVLALILGIVCYISFVVLPRVNANTAKVKSVQCSLYRLVLTSGYHPESRIDEEMTSEDQAENLRIYNYQYKTIVNDNNRLGCTQQYDEPDKYITNPKEATTTTTLVHK